MSAPKPPNPRSSDEVVPVSAPSAEGRGAGGPGQPANDEAPETIWERMGWALAKAQMWLGWGLLLGGVAAWLLLDWVSVGLAMMGGALIVSGLVPILTGYYRSGFGVLRGWKARARGFLSLGIGAVILLRVLLVGG